MSTSNPIAELRAKFRLQQKEAALRLGVTPRTLRDLEQRRTLPLRYELAVAELRRQLMKELEEL